MTGLPILPVTGAAAIAAAHPAQPAGPSAAARHQALDQAKAFEQILVQELCQELSSSVSGADGSTGSDGSGGSGDSTSGTSAGGDAGTSMFASLMPQALSASVTAAGGLGLAGEIAPSLLGPAGGAAA